MAEIIKEMVGVSAKELAKDHVMSAMEKILGVRSTALANDVVEYSAHMYAATWFIAMGMNEAAATEANLAHLCIDEGCSHMPCDVDTIDITVRRCVFFALANEVISTL